MRAIRGRVRAIANARATARAARASSVASVTRPAASRNVTIPPVSSIQSRPGTAASIASVPLVRPYVTSL